MPKSADPNNNKDDSPPSPKRILETMPGMVPKGLRVHVLFLNSTATTSNLTEQTLKGRGFHVTVVRHLEALMEEWRLVERTCRCEKNRTCFSHKESRGNRGKKYYCFHSGRFKLCIR